ncbi:MarR family transcriptional regulator [Pseudodesulfovibrio sp. zrk46]|uniref:MarR family winged helix-turn-helix transcriptional regulator n=1 Tax=Pseudodesulfovibrio sp. zrk46 TaxID=2725288 RepID=UPI001448A85C|nr:MarR family transcriptional regulator [Pseudodesulfovibrio sp. zrk46]QJB55149.1 MarR family transcriptional regulator [Pseudodesulfovibrio sp. zrk46]
MILDNLNPKEALGFLSWKLSRMLTNILTSLFVEMKVDVTVEQWRALIPIYKHDGMTQGKLCSHLSQEKTGVSRLVAALEKRELVRRVESEQDRRVKYLHITDKGRDLLESTMAKAMERHNEAVKHIDPVELAICKKVLWQIIEPTLDPDCIPLGIEDDRAVT